MKRTVPPPESFASPTFPPLPPTLHGSEVHQQALQALALQLQQAQQAAEQQHDAGNEDANMDNQHLEVQQQVQVQHGQVQQPQNKIVMLDQQDLSGTNRCWRFPILALQAAQREMVLKSQ